MKATPKGLRHGKGSSAFLGDLGRWWGALLTSLREHVADPAPPGGVSA
jgi:hypothetical protein